jgi:nucleotide-binding universal stress UspA family protein
MFKTILVPLDGSKRAERILPFVEDLAFARESKVIFLQVIEPVPIIVSEYDALPLYSQELVQSALDEANAYVAQLTSDFRAKGLDASPVVKYGPVVPTILEVAEQEKTDLIAMASHGRTGLACVFYGSVAAGILQRADRPLLLIRADGSSPSTESELALHLPDKSSIRKGT